MASMILVTAFGLAAVEASTTRLAALEARARNPAYETKYFTQSLTHSAGDARTFRQKYLISEAHVGRGEAPFEDLAGGCPGPILFYSGNEGPIEAFWGSNGFMESYLAPKWGAVVLMAEARYYGASLPFGNASWTPESVQWLTTELILADYAHLLTELKATVLSDYAACPVISFGGSYGATLTTFLRLTYPAVVAGGLAASAPIGYYDTAGWAANGVDGYTWTEIVERDYADASPTCLADIAAANAALEAAEPGTLVALFNLCSAAALGPSNGALFQYALESLPQLDYPHAVGAIPAWPVNATCAILGKASTDAARLKAAAEIAAFVLGTSAAECFAKLAEGPGGIPGDGPGPGAWGYQSCTETLHEFSSKSPIRDYAFDLEASTSLCESLFDDTAPDPKLLANKYGGYAIPQNVTNVIFSNGLRDPWSGGGFYPSKDAHPSNVFCVMPDGAHHGDLRGPRPDDPADIKACRDLEEQTIAKWIREF